MIKTISHGNYEPETRRCVAYATSDGFLIMRDKDNVAIALSDKGIGVGATFDLLDSTIEKKFYEGDSVTLTFGE